MITQERLEQEIKGLETAPVNLRNCEQLAVLRFLYSTYYAPPESYSGYSISESKVPKVSDSEFMQSISGINSDKAWEIMDELMSTLQILYPKTYNNVMRKISKK